MKAVEEAIREAPSRISPSLGAHPPVTPRPSRVLLPTAVLVLFSAWALADRNLGAFQVVASAPFLYVLVHSAVGAFAYRAKPRAEPDLAEEAWPTVSVLIPAHDEENVIGNTLDHVLRMRYPRFEVIVIDDASTDRTGEIASRRPVRVISRRDPRRRGKSEALNAGLAVATGEVVCVFDADTQVAPDFLRRAVAPLVARDDLCGVQAQVRMYNAARNALTRAQDDEFAIHNEVLQLGRERLGGACALGGNGQLTRRAALEAVGGWSPRSLTEDLDLTVRLFRAGCGRIAHVTDAVVWQEGVPGVRALVRQRTRWAEGILRCYAEHAGVVLTSRVMRPALRVDTFWTLFSVFLPVLSAMGLLFTGLNAIPGFFVRTLPEGPTLSLVGLAIVATCLASIVVSWKRDRRVTLVPALRSVVYMLHWLPAFTIALKNVVRDRPVVWAKTAHARPGRRVEPTRARAGARPAPVPVRVPTRS